MDLKSFNRSIITTSAVAYSLNVVLSLSLYGVLSTVGLPVSDPVLRGVLTSVPLVSGVFNALILGLILMSLKYAEYYGIAKSAIAIPIYFAYYFAFKPPVEIDLIMFSIVLLCVVQLVLLYTYAKLLKEMYG